MAESLEVKSYEESLPGIITWDGVERRERGADRNALDRGQSEVRDNIQDRVSDSLVNPKLPFSFFSRDALLTVLNPDIATRLRSFRFSDLSSGALLTVHRERPLASGRVEFDPQVKDLAGRQYSQTDDDVFSKTKLPIPGDEISYATVRHLPLPIGEPFPADWERFLDKEQRGKLGFGDPELGLIKTDAMAVAICQDGKWTDVNILPYSELGVSPNMQAIHYGGSVFEGITAEWSHDGICRVFNLQAHYKRINKGALVHGLSPLPSYEMFEKAVLLTIQQNARFIPGNGRLYIRPHLTDIGPHMKVGNSRITGFFIEATPIGSAESYFGAIERNLDGNVKGKGLAIPTAQVRSAEGLGGDKKGIGNYGLTPAVIREACSLNVGTEQNPLKPVGVLYLDRPTKGLSEQERKQAKIRETNAANIIFFEDLGDGRYRLVTPSLDKGDILPGNTRALILEKARARGWEVEERDVNVQEIEDGKFMATGSCGTAAIFSPVDWVHFTEISAESGKWESSLVGGKIDIRAQEAINANPIPEPIQILMQDVLDVKAGRNPEDTEKYLTEVPGVKRRLA